MPALGELANQRQKKDNRTLRGTSWGTLWHRQRRALAVARLAAFNWQPLTVCFYIRKGLPKVLLPKTANLPISFKVLAVFIGIAKTAK